MVQRLEGTDGPMRDSGDNLLRYLVGVISVLAILMYAVCFSVYEGRQGIVLRFGEPVRVIDQPGLHMKAPWPIERVVDIDARNRSISTPNTELLTRDKKNIVLITGGVWHTSDPVLFYRSLGSVANADEKTIGLVVNATIAVFGRYDLSALVSTDPGTLQVDQVEHEIREAVNAVAKDTYGIELTHVGFQRVSLPEQNVAFVLEQMRAERRQVAARFIADGQLEATRIRSAADLEAAQILAEAEEVAARTVGLAEAEAARIYADAHRTDPEFFTFIRSLETLRRTLGPTSFVTLRTDAEPFRLLVDSGFGNSAENGSSDHRLRRDGDGDGDGDGTLIVSQDAEPKDSDQVQQP